MTVICFVSSTLFKALISGQGYLAEFRIIATFLFTITGFWGFGVVQSGGAC